MPYSLLDNEVGNPLGWWGFNPVPTQELAGNAAPTNPARDGKEPAGTAGVLVSEPAFRVLLFRRAPTSPRLLRHVTLGSVGP